MLNLIHKLPKTDLHCHLGGSLRLKTVAELSGSHEPLKMLAKKVEAGPNCHDLPEFLTHFSITQPLLHEPKNVYRIAKELLEDAAAEGTRYLEIRFAPMYDPISEGGDVQKPKCRRFWTRLRIKKRF